MNAKAIIIVAAVVAAFFILPRLAGAASLKKKDPLADDPGFQKSLGAPKAKKCSAQTAASAAGWVATGAATGSIVPGLGSAAGATVGAGVFLVSDPCATHVIDQVGRGVGHFGKQIGHTAEQAWKSVF